MGNKDEALAWIEKAFERHSDVLTRLKVDPRFDPLRGDPRFQGLLRREAGTLVTLDARGLELVHAA